MRIVMRVEVQVVTDADNEDVEKAFRWYDGDGAHPSPVEYVAQAIAVAGHKDWDVPSLAGASKHSRFEIRVEGPQKWSAAYDAAKGAAAPEGQQRVARGGDARGAAGGDTRG